MPLERSMRSSSHGYHNVDLRSCSAITLANGSLEHGSVSISWRRCRNINRHCRCILSGTKIIRDNRACDADTIIRRSEARGACRFTKLLLGVYAP